MQLSVFTIQNTQHIPQLKNPAATTVGPTWEAVPVTTPVNTMATVAMTSTVSYKAYKIKSSRKMLHHFVYGGRMKVLFRMTG